MDRQSIIRIDYRPCPVQTVIISPYRAFILPLVRPQTAVVGVTQSPEGNSALRQRAPTAPGGEKLRCRKEPVSPQDPPRGSAAPAAADNLTGRCEVVNRDRRDRLTCNRIVAKRLIFRDYSAACNRSWLMSNRD